MRLMRGGMEWNSASQRLFKKGRDLTHSAATIQDFTEWKKLNEVIHDCDDSTGPCLLPGELYPNTHLTFRGFWGLYE